MVARVKVHTAGGERRLGVVGCRPQALEQHRADQRTTHRAGRALPVDRRAGVQERALLQAERRTRRTYVDQLCPRREQPVDRGAVGLRPPRVGHHAGQRSFAARLGRPPVDPPDRNGLVVECVGEQRHTGTDNPR